MLYKRLKSLGAHGITVKSYQNRVRSPLQLSSIASFTAAKAPSDVKNNEISTPHENFIKGVFFWHLLFSAGWLLCRLQNPVQLVPSSKIGRIRKPSKLSAS